MGHWSPYREDTVAVMEAGDVSLADVLYSPVDSEPLVFATGRHRTRALSPYLQYIDCRLTTTAPLEATGQFVPGICISHAFEGSWTSRIDGHSLALRSGGETLVYGSSRELDFLESQPENTCIAMAALYIGANFFDAVDVPCEMMALLDGNDLVSRHLAKAGALRSVLQQMFQAPQDGYLAGLHMTSLGLAAVVELGRALGAEPAVGQADRRQRERAHALRDYLDANIADLPSIPEIASLLATNESTLRRAFKATFGLSITTYVRNSLLDHARVLVRDGRLPLSVIAYRCGFATPANFTSAYRRQFGHPPSTEQTKSA